ncbi:hypothetical protein [Enterobacter asburiae]|uniref:hypothetical protein n=2 Tax=Enterobacter asburiae TaxID=61645 RepID=UPI003D6FE9F4
MPKKKKLVPNSGKSIAEIMKDNEVTNSEGRTSQAFSKDYDYFEDINCIYSEEYPEGKMLDLIHIKLYCRFKRYQNNGAKCYESQGKLGQICKCDPGTIGDKVKELVKMGLVITDEHPDPNISSLLYTALPLTDAHVIPPEALTVQPDIISDVVPEPATAVETQDDAPEHLEPPAPTMTNVIEDAVIVAESVPESVTADKASPRIRTSDAVKHLLENLSQRREDESFYSWSSRVLQRIGIDHSMGIEQLFQETLILTLHLRTAFVS